MSRFFLLSLYFISFTPLWISVIFIDLKNILSAKVNLYTEYISILLIIVGIIISSIFICLNLKQTGKEDGVLVTLQSSQKQKNITSEFLLSYILPLLAFDFTLWDNVVLFLIFFITFGYLCVKHSYFSANIILEIFKYNVYRCRVKTKDEKELDSDILSRGELFLFKGEEIKIKPLNNDYHFHILKKKS